MTLSTRTAAVVALPMLLAACAGFELQDMGGVKPVTDQYYSTLYSGYLGRAEHEQSYGHYVSADSYALKARAAAAGQNVTPFTPNDDGAFPDGMVPDNEVSAMMDGRRSLLDVLQAGARTAAPVDAANAQVMYDCWVEEQSYIGDFNEDNQPDHAAFCRDNFRRSLGLAQAAVAPKPQAAPQPAPAPQPQPMAEVPGSYLVFFDWDSATLSPDALQVISQAVDNARKGGITRLMAVGHADTSGTATYNTGLSQRRAEAVANALAARGISRNEIATEWLGETDPLVPTGDGVREPQNRRVEITFQGR